jgi:hypothetical protein
LAGLFALSKIGDFVLERGSFWGFLLISIVVSGAAGHRFRTA